jgi:hypothetical protein
MRPLRRPGSGEGLAAVLAFRALEAEVEGTLAVGAQVAAGAWQ